jgi:hypothetical protein
MPGSELSAVGNAIVLHICLCGRVVETSKVRGLPREERRVLNDSLNKARRFHQEHEPEQRKAKLRESFAVREEVESCNQRVEQLSKVAKDLKAQRDNPPALARTEKL